jgi:multidrug efflux system membrane fusion protein
MIFDLPVQWMSLVFARVRHLFAGRFGALWGISFFLVACSAETKMGEKPRPGVPVRVGTVLQKNVPVQLRVIGSVEAYSTVSIKSLVGGEILKVHFKEGQDVRKNDLLFTIDPRPLGAALQQAEANLGRDLAQVKQAEANLTRDMAQVNQAEANLVRDIAQLKYAEEEARRYAYLLEKNYVPKQQYEQIRTNAEALVATVEADKAAVENAQATLQANRAALENAQAAVRASRAAVENARIQLGYCFIRSPMNGRTGSLLVQQGNVVKENDIPLVVINQINPIYVTFSVPEKNLPEIKRYRRVQKLKVEAVVPGDEQHPEQGILTFVDNAVDATTGTIRLKGTFENREKRLWPGQFVNTILMLTVQPDAIVVLSQAVQTGQQGHYAFVVKPDLTVESRPLVVSRTIDGETIIAQGLKPGEKVVTDGQLRLVPGAKVEVKSDPGQEKQP